MDLTVGAPAPRASLRCSIPGKTHSPSGHRSVPVRPQQRPPPAFHAEHPVPLVLHSQNSFHSHGLGFILGVPVPPAMTCPHWVCVIDKRSLRPPALTFNEACGRKVAPPGVGACGFQLRAQTPHTANLNARMGWCRGSRRGLIKAGCGACILQTPRPSLLSRRLVYEVGGSWGACSLKSGGRAHWQRIWLCTTPWLFLQRPGKPRLSGITL